MKNKLLKIFLILIIPLFMVQNISAISNCDDARRQLDEAQQKLVELNCETGSTSICRRWQAKAQEAQRYIDANCSGCAIPPKPFNDENLNIPLNESGYILHKYSYNGESVFCIDPDTVYNPCATYNQGGNDLGNDLKVRIAKIVKAANNLGSPNNTEMYIGAQLYIWDLLGLPRTVNGYNKGSLKSRIDSEVSNLEGQYKPNISGEHEVEFNQDFIVTDRNNVLDRGNYSLHQETGGFAKSERNGNNITVNINSIYPTVKRLRVDATQGSINNYDSITFYSNNS